MIPLVDVKQQYEKLKEEIEEAIRSVSQSGLFVLGPEVQRFEESFASYCGVNHCIGVSSGTDALYISLKALGVGPGHEVITSPFTFIGTVLAISKAGAAPVFVDCKEDDYTIDTTKIEAAITPKTKAIIPVHLYGQAADMGAIAQIASKYNLAVIEDACQAHGAEYRSKRVGSLGTAGCFSFYPSKNLGAFGDGGAIVTNDEELAQRIRVLGNSGQSRPYHSVLKGDNCRLDSLQAAVLSVKLPHLDAWNEIRRVRAARYTRLLGNTAGIRVPQEQEDRKHVYHLYVVRSKKRDELARQLAERGIETRVYYPEPVHVQEAYKDLGYAPGSFPTAERAAQEVLALPLYPELEEEKVALVVKAIQELST